MSTGGIFTIITNDGKQDRMLMATALLHQRLAAINAYKLSQNGGAADDLANLPTLLDIEKTHVLFTNAHFKPFAAIGFEYNKVPTTSGSPTLSSTIQFSIPQFGDFFHDICCHVILTQPTLATTAVNNGDQPAMWWCNFPGERLLQRVQMEVNGNPLDEYTFHATNFFRQFRVQPNKLPAWNKCMGQEVANQAYLLGPTYAGNVSAVSAVVGRERVNWLNGNQTPTAQKTSNLELFIPLLFWYNKDVRLAVASVAIPYGQRFINMDLASQQQLVGLFPRGAGTFASPLGTLTQTVPMLSKIELYINNIFVNPEIHKIYIKRIGFSLIRVHRQQLYAATSNDVNVLLQQLKWPIEYMYVGMKVTSYFNSSSVSDQNQYLNAWDSFSTITTSVVSSGGQLMEQELALTTLPATATVGLAAPSTASVSALTGTGLLAQSVGVGAVLRIQGGYYTVVVGAAAGAAVTGVSVLAGALVAAAVDQSAAILVETGTQYTLYTYASNIDQITLSAHGIPIYDRFPSKFFNAYVPYHYGGSNVTSPTDPGACLVTLCLYPGTYQPSGHINVSRAREFYLEYVSSTISSGTPGTLVVVASALNFLLLSDGSAVLRYST